MLLAAIPVPVAMIILDIAVTFLFIFLIFASNTWPFLFLFFLFQNLEIKTDSAKALAESLDKAESPTFPYLNTLLRILTTRCMMQAVYFCSGMDNDFHHYGLASPIYTHFTSPIRRYLYFTKVSERKEVIYLWRNGDVVHFKKKFLFSIRFQLKQQWLMWQSIFMYTPRFTVHSS